MATQEQIDAIVARAEAAASEKGAKTFLTKTGKEVTGEDINTLHAFLISTVNGAAGDFGDELAGTKVGSAVGSAVLGTFGIDGTNLKETIRKNEKYLKDEKFGTYLISKIIGSVVPGALIGKGLKGLGLLGKGAGALRTAAVTGAVEGAGSGDAETLSGRASDAAIGGALGVAGGVVGAGVSKLVSKSKSSSEKVLERVAKAVSDDQDPGELSNLLKSQIEAGSASPLKDAIVGTGKMTPDRANELVEALVTKDPKAMVDLGRQASTLIDESKKAVGTNRSEILMESRQAKKQLGEAVGASKREVVRPVDKELSTILNHPNTTKSAADAVKRDLASKLSARPEVKELANIAGTGKTHAEVLHVGDLPEEFLDTAADGTQFFVKTREVLDGEVVEGWAPIPLKMDELHHVHQFLKARTGDDALKLDANAALTVASRTIDEVSEGVKNARHAFAGAAQSENLIKTLDDAVSGGLSSRKIYDFYDELEIVAKSGKVPGDKVAQIARDVIELHAHRQGPKGISEEFFEETLQAAVEKGFLPESALQSAEKAKKVAELHRIMKFGKEASTESASMLSGFLKNLTSRLPEALMFRDMGSAFLLASSRAGAAEVSKKLGKTLGVKSAEATRVLDGFLGMSPENVGSVLQELSAKKSITEGAFWKAIQRAIPATTAAGHLGGGGPQDTPALVPEPPQDSTAVDTLPNGVEFDLTGTGATPVTPDTVPVTSGQVDVIPGTTEFVL